MGKVVYDISMSLDGFITAARPDSVGTDGGRRATAPHDWAFGDDERDREVLSTGLAGTGAVITGRRNYTDALPWWGADGPTGPGPAADRSCSATRSRPTRRRPAASTPS